MTDDPMISGIDGKRLSKKYPLEVCLFLGALGNDLDHYQRTLSQKP